jgi:hypothetical protein
LLELDASRQQLLAPGVELALADREGDVAGSRRAVRGDRPARLRGAPRVEEQQHAAVVEPERAASTSRSPSTSR